MAEELYNAVNDGTGGHVVTGDNGKVVAVCATATETQKVVGSSDKESGSTPARRRASGK